MENRICWVASTDEDGEKTKTRKGPWTSEEDMKLIRYISLHGQGRWNFLAKAAGLKRTGKSCRLRWNNCLRPDLKRSKITPEEERLIIELHGRWGNRWSRIAESLPGRTDNEIKNCWRTRIKRKLNLQAKGRNSGMDADNRIDFEFSKGSHSLTTTSEILSDLDSAEPSSSFPRQSTGEIEEIEVQTNKTPNLQNDIWAQAIPVIEENYDSVLQGEIDHGSSEIIEDGQPWLALKEHCEGTDNLFEKSSLNHFSVRSLIATLISSGATEDDTIPSSPETFSDSEFYFIDYSDVLWNMDEEDECFIPSPHCYEQ